MIPDTRALTTFFVDTFTSSSGLVPLIGHVPNTAGGFGDKGQGWIAAQGPFAAVSASNLNLNGTLRCVAGATGAALAIDTPPSQDQRISWQISSGAPPMPIGDDFYLLFRWVDQPVPHGYAIRIRRNDASSPTFNFRIWLQRYTPAGNNLDLLGNGGDVIYGGNIGGDGGGNTQASIIGSVLQLAGTDVAHPVLSYNDLSPILHVGKCGLAFGPGALGNLYMNQWFAEADPAAAIPPNFWRDYVKTYEVIPPTTMEVAATPPPPPIEMIEQLPLYLPPSMSAQPRLLQPMPLATFPFRDEFLGVNTALDGAQWDDSGSLDYYGNYAPGTLRQSSGRCTCPTNYGEALGKQNPTTKDYYVEMKGHIPLTIAPGGFSGTFNLYARAVDSSHGYQLTIEQEGHGSLAGYTRIALLLDRFWGPLTNNTWQYFASPDDWVVRLECVESHLRVLLNGVEVMNADDLSATGSGPLTAPGNMGYFMQTNGKAVWVDYMEIGLLGAPPPTVFWTDFVKSQEVTGAPAVAVAEVLSPSSLVVVERPPLYLPPPMSAAPRVLVPAPQVGTVYCNLVTEAECFSAGMSGVFVPGPSHDIGVYIEFALPPVGNMCVYGYSNLAFTPDTDCVTRQGMWLNNDSGGPYPGGSTNAMAYTGAIFKDSFLQTGYKDSGTEINRNSAIGITGPASPSGVIVRFRDTDPNFFLTQFTLPATTARSEPFANVHGSLFGWCWGFGGGTVPATVTKFKVYDWGTDGTPPVDPPPPVVGAVLLENFTGTSGTTVVSHVSDSGHTWKNDPKGWANSGSPLPAELTLDGGGFCGVNTGNYTYVSVVSNVALPADCYIEAKVRINAYTTSGRVIIQTRYNPADGSGYVFEVANGYDPDAVLDCYAYPGSNVDNGIGFGSAPADPANYLLRIEHEGTTIRIFIEGNLIATYTDSQITQAGTVGFTIRANVYAHAGLNFIKAGPLHEPPSLFWTDLVKAKELT